MSLDYMLDQTVDTIDELDRYIKLSKDEKESLEKVIDKHPMRISRYYLSLIDKNDPKDPIRRMIVPSIEELDTSGYYDTSGEAENTKMIGLQHKYPQTALILSTNRCATYCRYCFRKRLVGLSSREVIQNFRDAVNYIKEHEEISNVLISGGDPLTLSTKMIRKFLEMLSEIDHLCFIRFGTKIPVSLPERILTDEELLSIFKEFSVPNRRIYIVTQFNHPREITEEAISAIDLLLKSNVLVNNQTVLLKGVNDDPEILAELMNQLVSIGVSPYYVFQCRPVKRVTHFQVPLIKGYRIIKETKNMLDGFGKRFRYIMSHKTGKIEIVGMIDNEIYFKYHQARDPRDRGKVFKKRIIKDATWIDDF
ncbi:MAG: KamA family radical SAM protein [Candidatus Methanoliparum thermophilum]|uniref:KamA family radical SAM protein n=1 Tax=Methanoliparum thermophilum TaxID=2491083 RepID=A0A520KSP2_METT2|nr:KamA family radical SAM protein [Candidatus Methanoliparum sp. LAM-1]RZN64904.1 MAG: KamA family radical SAM protein [Candidatus Methanoliparum thermophilum]BDC36220.1 KamA family radical SAM protein [Candidatus Methanoliparum sp. LAM-1]